MRAKTNLQKDASVETMRGVAILMIVFLHCISTAHRDYTFYTYFDYLTTPLHLPLFALISGVVYAFKPVSSGYYMLFVKNKIRRILIPFMVVATIFYGLRSLLPFSTHQAPLSEIWKVYIFSYEHLWFLQAIFVVFLIIAFLEYTRLISQFKYWLVILLIGFILSVNHPPINFFSLNGTAYLFPYFLLGYGLVIYNHILSQKRVIIFFLVIFILSFLTRQFVWFFEINWNIPRVGYLNTLISMSFCVVAFFTFKHIPSIAYVGNHSYTIYLYHPILISASIKLFSLIGINNIHITFAFSFIIATILPILFENIVKKIPVVRTFFLGLKP